MDIRTTNDKNVFKFSSIFKKPKLLRLERTKINIQWKRQVSTSSFGKIL